MLTAFISALLPIDQEKRRTPKSHKDQQKQSSNACVSSGEPWDRTARFSYTEVFTKMDIYILPVSIQTLDLISQSKLSAAQRDGPSGRSAGKNLFWAADGDSSCLKPHHSPNTSGGKLLPGQERSHLKLRNNEKGTINKRCKSSAR